MSNIKRCFANFSPFDQKTIETKLEEMAAEGWMIQKLGNLFWTYERMEPQKLHFAVTYFPDASEFDPKPSEGQLTREEFCAQDGWHLAVRWGAMQIFYSTQENPVPIDTDPVTQVETICRTMKKTVVSNQLVSLSFSIFYLVFQMWDLWHDPVDYLSSTHKLMSLPMWILLLILEAYELWSCLRWCRRAKKAAQDGVFLPVRIRQWFSWFVLAVAALFLLLSMGESAFSASAVAFGVVMTFIGMAVGNGLSRWLKEQGASRRVNMVVSSLGVLVAVIFCFAGMIALMIGNRFPFSPGSTPVDTYEWNGHTYDIYDDSIPLELEDLVEVDARWSKKAEIQESVFLTYGRYTQRPLYSEEVDYQIRYDITDIKVSALYPFLKESLVNERQDQLQGDFVFVDHFEPADPAPWEAQEAYQLLGNDGLMDTYLICWEDRIVEIHFYWTPTSEQIARAADILHR